EDAITQNGVERLEEILGDPQNPEFRLQHGRTGLAVAASKGHLECFSLLLE
ncbi:unnamed protein product, partial [Symbiodinium pilosum]